MSKTFFDNFYPNNLDDINLNEDTSDILNMYLRNNKMLFLIYGQNLSGKTSLIKILLKNYYNSLDYSENIIYINILKEQGINFFRNDIRNFCQINNSHMNKIKKSIIIDDFDFLNEINQKVLLHYVNKYNNINFIVSCSDLNKLILSTQYHLELIKIEDMDNKFLEKIYNKIVKKTNLSLDDNVKYNLLDKFNKNIPFFINKLLELNIMYYNDINNTSKKNYKFLDNNILINIENYLNLCEIKDIKKANNFILNLHKNGLSVIDILDNIIFYIKNINKKINEKIKFEIILLVTNYIHIFNNLHEDNIELLFLTNNMINIFIKN